MILLTLCPILAQSNFQEKTIFKNQDVEIRQLDEHTWHGNGTLVFNESIYLIEGETSAILIDAGTKMPGLKKIVENIVKKPVSLVISHAHGDHIGAINEWDTVWINAADEAILSAGAYKGVKRYLTDGQIFDLGGRKIEVIFTPGHTPGSTTFIDREAHYGFSSDAFGSGNLLVFTDLTTQEASCQRLSRFIEKYGIRYLYPGHYWGDNLETPQRVKDVATICRGILEGDLQATKGTNGALPYVVERYGVKVNFGRQQLRLDAQIPADIEASKLVALSFDDGPNTETTVQMLDVLKKHGVKASFFVIGNNINDESAKVMQRAHREGHDIENHSLTHCAMPTLTADSMRSEIAQTSALIEKYVGERPLLFRPPYIALSRTMFDNIGLTFICGEGCNDWEPQVTADQRLEKMLAAARDGLIFLLHDFEGNKNTVEAVDRLIPLLQQQGYRFVTVRTLFREKNVPMQPGIIYTDLLNAAPWAE